MRTITPTCFGFALAISAFSLISRPASAVEAPAVTATAPNNVIRVHDDDWRDYRKREHEERKRWKHEEHEARKHSERCEHVRYECSESYDYSRHEFYECVERHDCEG